MALFGRKKAKEAKTKASITAPPRPTKTPFYQQSNHTHTRTHSTPTQQHPIQYEERPHTSHGHHQPAPQSSHPSSSQGWLAVPGHHQVQPHVHFNHEPQHYPPPRQPVRPQKSSGALSRLNFASMTNLLQNESPIPPYVPGARIINDGLSPFQMQGTQYLNQGAALCDQIATKFNEVITLIDGDLFSGNESQLVVHSQPQPQWQQQQPENIIRGIGKGRSKGVVNNSMSSALVSTNYFAKVNLYANSRLPPSLPPLKLYMPTYPLLCLAAQYSERVYTRPAGKERDAHVDADWRMGTKAMVIKSVPMDDMHTIVFAIRGSQTFMDWAVNLNSAPASPGAFLDDPGNFCHAGFLTVARKMIKPVAARLRTLLQEDPNRSRYSLLITGHSAGGAVAALLYSHMLATGVEAESELNILTGCFKRVHCVTFGAPPVSLLPLTKPNHPAFRKSIFMSFVNEGDPVPRADKAYVRSLLDLYSSPAPLPGPSQTSLALSAPSKLSTKTSTLTLNKFRSPIKNSQVTAVPVAVGPIWQVPVATLCCAGRIVLLRSVQRYDAKPGKRKTSEMMNEGVVAQTISDELMRGVVWGDPICHVMKLYARRIEVLATNAVLGRT